MEVEPPLLKLSHHLTSLTVLLTPWGLFLVFPPREDISLGPELHYTKFIGTSFFFSATSLISLV